MHVKVRLHGDVTKYLPDGRDTGEFEINEAATVRTIVDQLGLTRQEYVLFAVNGETAGIDTPLRPGDVLECVAPISGG
jgi:sulfur carrier protein ThiS